MKNLILFPVLFILFISCTRTKTNDNALEFTNDVDGMAYWSDYSVITHFIGHSGNFACKIDSVNSFSLAFRRKMGEITDKPVLRVEVSAWVYVNQLTAKGNIVCALDSAPGKGFVYLAEAFDDKLKKEQKWTKVSSVFYLPRTYNPDFILSAYLWNTGKEEIFIDDFYIKLTEY